MTEKSGKNLRFAVISALARRSKVALGRTAIMKLTYFLQTLKEVPLDYSFRLYTYGPYDPQVLNDLKIAEMIGAVRSSIFSYPGGYGYEIMPADRADEVIESAHDDMAKYEQALDEIIEEFGSRTAGELEMASTIIYVDRACATAGEQTSLARIASQVEEIKPHLESRLIVAEAERLARGGALRSVAH